MLGFYLCYGRLINWIGCVCMIVGIIDGYCCNGEIDDGWLHNSYEDSLN